MADTHERFNDLTTDAWEDDCWKVLWLQIYYASTHGLGSQNINNKVSCKLNKDFCTNDWKLYQFLVIQCVVALQQN